jgi:hypothetical protein
MRYLKEVMFNSNKVQVALGPAPNVLHIQIIQTLSISMPTNCFVTKYYLNILEVAIT